MSVHPEEAEEEPPRDVNEDPSLLLLVVLDEGMVPLSPPPWLPSWEVLGRDELAFAFEEVVGRRPSESMVEAIAVFGLW